MMSNNTVKKPNQIRRARCPHRAEACEAARQMPQPGAKTRHYAHEKGGAMRTSRPTGKVLLFGLFAMLILALTGCQLAQEGAGQQEDARLIGVFLTTEHLDLIDHASIEGIQIPMRRGQPDFSAFFMPGRLYAEWDNDIGEFRFPIDGIPFFSAVAPAEYTPWGHVTTSHASPAITGGGSHHFFGDNYARMEMTGTIRAVPGAQAAAFVSMNTVFQTADGRVFLTSGSGYSFHGNTTEGRIWSVTLSESITTTQNRVENTYSATITINLETMFPPERFVLLQMDKDSQIVRRTEFTPDQTHQPFHLEAATEYLILETHRAIPAESAHNDTIIRELLTSDTSHITIPTARHDGIIEKHWMQIIWP